MLPMLRGGDGGCLSSRLRVQSQEGDATSGLVREELRNRIPVKGRVAQRDVLDPFRRDACMIDHESRSIAGRRERKTERGVDAWLPGRRMRGAKTPRLYDPLARHKLNLPALHSTAENGEEI